MKDSPFFKQAQLMLRVMPHVAEYSVGSGEGEISGTQKEET